MFAHGDSEQRSITDADLEMEIEMADVATPSRPTTPVTNQADMDVALLRPDSFE